MDASALQMDFSLEGIPFDDIQLQPDLISLSAFLARLRERADEREWSMLRGVSIIP
ncbi:MAG: hypothetical protein ACM3XO_13750 [Bacteroidota bacterium]